MRAALALLVATAATLVPAGAAHASHPEQMVTVGPGVVRPVYPPGPEQSEIPVEAFRLDRFPVTNGAFLDFVRAHPTWRRDQVKALYADGNYLSHWAGPLELGPAVDPSSPVTRVSWFAARAFCRARGARLPTEMEWELAAAADETEKDARRNPAFTARILAWYSQPTPKVLPRVGERAPNAWGVHDLHGLIWEWVDDFNNTLVTGDSREPRGDKVKFCGAGAAGAGNGTDYAAFMRIAFRSSLEGRYTIGNLGFRCARSLDAGKGASR